MRTYDYVIRTWLSFGTLLSFVQSTAFFLIPAFGSVSKRPRISTHTNIIPLLYITLQNPRDFSSRLQGPVLTKRAHWPPTLINIVTGSITAYSAEWILMTGRLSVIYRPVVMGQESIYRRNR